jgi:hypothetical protein
LVEAELGFVEKPERWFARLAELARELVLSE